MERISESTTLTVSGVSNTNIHANVVNIVAAQQYQKTEVVSSLLSGSPASRDDLSKNVDDTTEYTQKPFQDISDIPDHLIEALVEFFTDEPFNIEKNINTLYKMLRYGVSLLKGNLALLENNKDKFLSKFRQEVIRFNHHDSMIRGVVFDFARLLYHHEKSIFIKCYISNIADQSDGIFIEYIREWPKLIQSEEDILKEPQELKDKFFKIVIQALTHHNQNAQTAIFEFLNGQSFAVRNDSVNSKMYEMVQDNAVLEDLLKAESAATILNLLIEHTEVIVSDDLQKTLFEILDKSNSFTLRKAALRILHSHFLITKWRVRQLKNIDDNAQEYCEFLKCEMKQNNNKTLKNLEEIIIKIDTNVRQINIKLDDLKRRSDRINKSNLLEPENDFLKQEREDASIYQLIEYDLEILYNMYNNKNNNDILFRTHLYKILFHLVINFQNEYENNEDDLIALAILGKVDDTKLIHDLFDVFVYHLFRNTFISPLLLRAIALFIKNIHISQANLNKLEKIEIPPGKIKELIGGLFSRIEKFYSEESSQQELEKLLPAVLFLLDEVVLQYAGRHIYTQKEHLKLSFNANNSIGIKAYQYAINAALKLLKFQYSKNQDLIYGASLRGFLNSATSANDLDNFEKHIQFLLYAGCGWEEFMYQTLNFIKITLWSTSAFQLKFMTVLGILSKHNLNSKYLKDIDDDKHSCVYLLIKELILLLETGNYETRCFIVMLLNDFIRDDSRDILGIKINHDTFLCVDLNNKIMDALCKRKRNINSSKNDSPIDFLLITELNLLNIVINNLLPKMKFDAKESTFKNQNLKKYDFNQEFECLISHKGESEDGIFLRKAYSDNKCYGKQFFLKAYKENFPIDYRIDIMWKKYQEQFKKVEELTSSFRYYVPLNYVEKEEQIDLAESSSESRSSLKEKIDRWIDDKNASNIMLIQGRMGSGKSLFGLNLTRERWNQYKPGGAWIPLLVNLKQLKDPTQNCIEQALHEWDFEDEEIRSLKKSNKKLLLFFDGLDEFKAPINLYHSNQLDTWKNIKVIITCRVGFLRDNYKKYFGIDDKDISKLFIASFNSVQRNELSKKIVESVNLSTQKPYTISKADRINIISKYIEDLQIDSRLKGSPFIIKILVDIYDKLQLKQEMRFNQAHIFHTFIEQWHYNKAKAFNANTDSSPIVNSEKIAHYSMSLAFDMFLDNDRTIVRLSSKGFNTKYKTDEWGWYLSDDPSIKAALQCSPILYNENRTIQFIHKSVQDYYVSLGFFEEISIDKSHKEVCLFNKKLLTMEHREILNFLKELILNDEEHCVEYIENLFKLLQYSRENFDHVIASANAATLLAFMQVPFSGKDLSKTKIPGANLMGACLDSVLFKDADLSKVCLQDVWLRSADLTNANLKGAAFNQSPFFKHSGNVTYLKSGNPQSVIGCPQYLATAKDNIIYLWDCDTGRRYRNINSCLSNIIEIAFNWDNQLLIYVDEYGVFSYDIKKNESKLLKKIQKRITAGKISSDCKWIALKATVDSKDFLWITLVFSNEKKYKFENVMEFNFDPTSQFIALQFLDNSIQLIRLSDFYKQEESSFIFPQKAIARFNTDAKFCQFLISKKGNGVQAREIFSDSFQDYVSSVKLKEIRDIQIDYKNKKIALLTADGFVVIWNAEKKENEQLILKEFSRLDYITFSQDGNFLVLASNKMVKLKSISNNYALSNYSTEHTRKITRLVLGTDGDYVHVFFEGNVKPISWNIINGLHKTDRSIELSPTEERYLSKIIDDGKKFYIDENNKTIKIYDNKYKRELLLPYDHFNQSSFTPNKIAKSTDKSVKVDIFDEFKRVRRKSYQFSSDRKIVAFICDTTLYIWRLDSALEIRFLTKLPEIIIGEIQLAFCEGIIAIGNEKGVLRVWKQIKMLNWCLWGATESWLYAENALVTGAQGLGEANRILLEQLHVKGQPLVDQSNFPRYSSLHLAIMKGDEENVRYLLNTTEGQDALDNCDNNEGDTPLHLAVVYNNVKIIELLLENKANFCIKNLDGKTPGDYANDREDDRGEILEILPWCSHEGPKDNFFYTAIKEHKASVLNHLIVASQWGKKWVSDNELNKHVNTKIKKANISRTLLCIAIEEKFIEGIRLLIRNAQADPSEIARYTENVILDQDGFSESLLYLAIGHNWISETTGLEILDLNSPADISERLKIIKPACKPDMVLLVMLGNECRPYFLAASNEWVQGTSSKDAEFVAQIGRWRLINEQTAIDEKTVTDKKNILKKANELFQENSVNALVEREGGEKIELDLNFGKRSKKYELITLLHLTVENRSLAMAQLLFSLNLRYSYDNLNPNLVDKNGETALCIAIKEGQKPLAEFFLSLELNKSQKSNDGHIKLGCSSISKKSGFAAVTSFVTSAVSAISGRLTIKDIERKDLNYYLHVAVKFKRDWAINLLLNCDLNKILEDHAININDYHGNDPQDNRHDIFSSKPKKTAIYIAVEENYIEGVEALLNYQSSEPIDLQVSDTSLPEGSLILCAIQRGHVEIAKKLLDFNKNKSFLDMKNKHGKSVLHSAIMIIIKNEDNKLLETLLSSKEVSLNETDNQKQTVLHLAVKYRRNDLVKIIHASLISQKLEDRIKFVNAQEDNEGNSALHLAAKLGDCQILNSLFDFQGVDSKLKNKDKDTPLDLAISTGKVEAFFRLSDKNLNPGDLLDLWLAKNKGQIRNKEFLEKIFQILHERSGATNKLTENETLLHFSLKYNHKKLSVKLIELNCQMNIYFFSDLMNFIINCNTSHEKLLDLTIVKLFRNREFIAQRNSKELIIGGRFFKKIMESSIDENRKAMIFIILFSCFTLKECQENNYFYLFSLSRKSSEAMLSIISVKLKEKESYVYLQHSSNRIRGFMSEYIEESTLCHVLHNGARALPWIRVRCQIAMDIAKGLEYLHSKDIIYADLKSSSVLLTRFYSAKLGDSGSAQIMIGSKNIPVLGYSTENMPSSGSLQTIIPRFYEPGLKYDQSIDLFAYAIILWEIANRKTTVREITKKGDCLDKLTYEMGLKANLSTFIAEQNDSEEDVKAVLNMFIFLMQHHCWQKKLVKCMSAKSIVYYWNSFNENNSKQPTHTNTVIPPKNN